MRAVHYIFSLFVLLASMVLTPSICSAQSERNIERSTMPDSLSRSYRHAEAVKRLTIDSDTVAACDIWQKIVAEDTTYAPAYYYLHLLENDRLKALEYARRAYAADTTNKWYVRGYASSLIATRKYSQAIPAYRRLMRLSPKDIEAYHALAILYSYNKMPYSAISILDSAELRAGYNPYLGEMKLHLLIDTRQYDKAIATGKRGVMEQPYDTNARINLAEAYEVAGHDSLARATLDEAFKIDTTNIATIQAISGYYERKGDTRRMLDYEERLLMDKSIAIENKLQRIGIFTSNMTFYAQNYIRIGGIIQRLAIAYPNNRAVVDCYAEHMLALGNIEQAAEYLARHLSNEDTTAEHYINLLQIYHHLERKDELFEVLDEALHRYPNSIDIISFAGFLASESDMYDDAIELFKLGLKSCTNDGDRSQLWGYIGDIYHEIGKDSKAFKAYRKALGYNPDNIAVLNNYAYFLSIIDKDLDLALEMSQQVNRLEPGNATYIDTYAWVLHRLGRNEEAKSAMSQALSLSAQRDASLLIHYADILWALGEKFMADTYWKKAAEQGYDKEALEEHITELKSQTETVKSKNR
ncbi:MAG: tetratricopeptide repeat protein [Alistipes sp.]|nr:tetratricopeptide repeat protein [Alistipes sp.]